MGTGAAGQIDEAGVNGANAPCKRRTTLCFTHPCGFIALLIPYLPLLLRGRSRFLQYFDALIVIDDGYNLGLDVRSQG